MICEEGKVKLILERIYTSEYPEEEEFLIYELNTNDLIYKESYDGISITENVICVNPVVHRLVLNDSSRSEFDPSYGWSDGSKLIISSESGIIGNFTLSYGSLIEILLDPIIGEIVGMIDETIIRDCSELDTIPSNATSLIIGSNICNFVNITQLNLRNYVSLESIRIGSDSFMYVDKFVLDGLKSLKSLIIGNNSFTHLKSDNNWDSDKANNTNRSFHILNCIELESIEIGHHSFSDYGGGFELINLPKLSTIKIGEVESRSSNFFYSSFVIKGIMDIILLMNRSSTFEFH